MKYLAHGIKSLSFLLIALSLLACGGGGTGSSSDALPEPSLNSSTFDQYSGITSAAPLNDTNFQPYVSAVFDNTLKMLNTDASSKPLHSTKLRNKQITGRTLIEETNACALGGTEFTKGFINDDLTGYMEINYDHCNDGSATLTGTVLVYVHDAEYSTFRANAYYKKVLVTENGNNSRVSGRIKFSTESLRDKYIVDLLEVDLDTSIETKFENYIFYDCEYCTYPYEETISGRIYHADQGYVDVSTPQPLTHVNRDQPSQIIGKILLSGEDNSSVTLKFYYIEVYEFSVTNNKKYLLSIQVDQDGDLVADNAVIIPTSVSTDLLVYNIDDSDSDGMPDGWELIHSLDPFNASDAELDADGDGYSNLLEYLHYSNPHDSAALPIVVDLSLEFETISDISRAGRPQSVTMTAMNPNTSYGASDVTFTVTKSSNVEWASTSGCGWSETNANTMTCHIDNIPNDFGLSVSVDVVGEAEEFQLSASVTSSTPDFNLDNNNDTFAATFNQRQSNIGLMPDFDSSLNGRNDVAAIGYSHVFDIHISQWGPDDAHNAVFRMDLPDHVEVNSATYEITGASSGPCSILTEIVCNLGTIYHNGASTKGFIQIRVTGLSEGYGSYTGSLSSDADETNPVDNSFSKELFVGQSLLSIQDIIDSATAPLTIDLAPGMYVGGLDGTGKELTINGDSTPGATIVRTYSPIPELSENFLLRSNSSVQNIFFDGSDYPGNNEKMAIYASGSDILIAGNIIEHSGTNNIGIVTYGDNITIRNNIIRNSETNSGCKSIYMQNHGSYTLENNLIYNNACSAIVFDNIFPDASTAISHIVTNNTIFNNTLGISEDVVLEGSTHKIQNNIIMDNDVGIAITRNASVEISSLAHSMPIVTNNLIYQNTVTETSPTDLIATFFTSGDNLNQDPLFIDPPSSDYHLSNTSPGIDAGVDLDSPPDDIEGTTRPLDGNFDTIPTTDIGAYEFTP